MQREVDGLLSYVPGLLRDWTPSGYDDRHMRVAGTLAFVDISGFTRLTERLARRGKVGAEEMSDLLSGTFAGLLAEAQEDGADLVKWGGDAMLLLFQGDGHPERAARSAHRMRARLRVVGRLPTTSGTVNLRMSVGVHSGEFDFFLVGDPDLHRELVLSGPSATLTAATEAAAPAGQIGLSAATAALLPPRVLGPALHDGRLLRSAPPRTVPPVVTVGAGGPGPPRCSPHRCGRTCCRGRRAGAPPGDGGVRAVLRADQLLASAGPGPLADALDEWCATCSSACDDHDVTFLESDVNVGGGKIVLLAGAPVSADRDEERMLRVARVVLDRAGRLPLRIGVNRGHVFAGDFGPVFRRTYSVKGDAVNLAARLASAAVPGKALATADVSPSRRRRSAPRSCPRSRSRAAGSR